MSCTCPTSHGRMRREMAWPLPGLRAGRAPATDGAEKLLGFDAVGRPCRVTRPGELGLLRMALHTIAGALGRQMLEQERNRLETRLEHARRLETVGTVASGIAQDLGPRAPAAAPPANRSRGICRANASWSSGRPAAPTLVEACSGDPGQTRSK